MGFQDIITSLLLRLLGREKVNDLVARLIVERGLDVLYQAHKAIGISNFGSMEETGESLVVQKVLPLLLGGPRRPPVFFDVGANAGDFSALLLEKFKEARVFAFEPNESVLDVLHTRLAYWIDRNQVCIEPVGLGATATEATLYSFSKLENSALGTVHGRALDLFSLDDEVASFRIKLISLDEYCRSKEIEHVDFLKIDVEGSELSVLQGARDLVRNDRIEIIQFEFNEFNVFSRTFLRDFYDILPKHRFFRLTTRGLFALGSYKAIDEVFKYQNILALGGNLDLRVLGPWIVR